MEDNYISPTKEAIQKVIDARNQKGSNKSDKPRKDNTLLLKKFFKINKEEKTIRILPISSDSSIFVEPVFFHNYIIGNKVTRMLCTKHNIGMGGKCAACERCDEILATQPKFEGKYDEQTDEFKDNNKAIFKDAMKHNAELYYVVRVLDRGAIDDGIKFWFFKASKKNQGNYDKLIAKEKSLYESNPGIPMYGLENGIDLKLFSALDKTPTGQEYYKLLQIEQKAPSKLMADEADFTKIITELDSVSWQDVVTPKKCAALGIDEFEYMRLASLGIAPYYKDNVWVDPRPDNEKNTVDTSNIDTKALEDKLKNQEENPDTDDLPF